ncbi:MAG: HNH endonuclease [Patescibacteria group bacterium]
MRIRKWSIAELREAAKKSTSFRGVIKRLGLVPAGGNYSQVQRYLSEYDIDYSHFKGAAWNKGLHGLSFPRISLEEVLKKDSAFQSHKLKKRLFKAGIKKPKCEICGWNKKNADGYQPLELHHVNGNKTDNRLVNLRILCPNCHSLQPTHRGRNIGKIKG